MQVEQKKSDNPFRFYWIAAMVLGLAPCGSVYAEEGGSGHYQPGSIASFIDAVPPEKTFLVRYNLVRYKGSVSPSVRLPIGGSSTTGASADIWAHGLTMLWAPGWKLGDWNYAMSTTVPLLDAKVDARVESSDFGTRDRSDSLTRMGDIILMPLMLNYTVSPDLNVNLRTTFYAPTGDYKTGRLANTGKNFWTFEPTAGVVYMGQKNGREASVYAGLDFNTENDKTDYKSGNQFHIDSTFAQHFPLAGGVAGAGVSGYYYKQVTGDSGDGATFGDFKAKSVGAGPVISYIRNFGKWEMLSELKWLHEFSTTNRLDGDVVLFKVAFKQ